MKVLRFVTILIVFGCLALPTFAEGSKEDSGTDTVTLRYAHVGVDGAPQTRYAEELAAAVEERTDGRVKMVIFPNSQLGNTSEMVDGVKTGSISMAHHDFATLGRLVPNLSVFSGPFVFRDAEHAVKAGNPSTSPVLREMNEELKENGNMRIIGSFYRGARQLTTTNFPVYTPDDVAGKKIRGVPNPIWMTMLNGMGAIPTPVEFPELATALLTGLVVGQENPLTNIYAAKLYEVQDYFMMTSHMQSVLCTFINEDIWQTISKDDQKVIEDVANEISLLSLEWAKSADDKIKEELRGMGKTIIEESDGLDLDAFRTQVLAQVNVDFPEWTPIIAEIAKIK